MSRKISVIIPVYREEETINRTLSHLLRLNGSEYIEIIVVEGQNDGATLRAVKAPEITKLVGPKGRGVQMNLGAKVAVGDILVFLHADTLLPATAFEAICSAVKQPHIVGGAFDLGIDEKGKQYRLIESAVRVRTRLTRIPYGDQAIFIKKNVFRGIGGFPEISIMEDVALMRRIRQKGLKIIILPTPVTTSARRWAAEGVLFCTLRNFYLLMLYSMGVSPERLVHHYP